MVTILFFMSVMQTTQAQIQSQSSGNWNNASTWVGNVVPNSSTTDVEIISGHTITMNSDVTIRNVIVTNGNLSIGSNKLQIHGNISGAQKDNVTSNTNSTIELLGSTTTPKFEFPLGVQKLKKIIINRKLGATSNHDIDLDDGVPADGIVLQLIHGIIYMTNGSIMYLNSKQIQPDIPGSDSSHIDGIVQRNIPKNSGIYTFPVGNNGHFRPFGVGLQNGNSDNINQVEFIWDTPINNTDINYNNLPGGIIQYFYWKHTVISGGNPQRQLSYTDNDFPNITAAERIASMTLANTDGTNSWDKATTPWNVNDTLKSIQFDNSNNSNSTYWTLGSVLGSVSFEGIHLPITLVDFNAEVLDDLFVKISWTTAQESNSEKYILQKSINGKDFYPIDTIPAAGFSSVFTYYESIDSVVNYDKVYYKLLEFDFNGASIESDIIEVEIPISKYKFDCFSYPISHGIVVRINNSNNNSTVYIYDSYGKLYFTKNNLISNNDYTIPIHSSGIYIVKIISNNKIDSRKLIVQ